MLLSVWIMFLAYSLQDDFITFPGRFILPLFFFFETVWKTMNLTLAKCQISVAVHVRVHVAQ